MASNITLNQHMTTKVKIKRQRKPKEGDVLATPLGDGSYGFGQVCHTGDYAFFDLRAVDFPSIEDIVARPVAFRVPMVGGSAKAGGWVVLGNLPPAGPLAEAADYRNQPVGSNQLYLIKGNECIPASYEEVRDLELMSWWFEHHVVERLQDHFAGRENPMAERFNKIKTYDPQTGQEIDPETGQEIKRGPHKFAQVQASAGNDVKGTPATSAALSKLHDFAAKYDHLIALLRATGDERLVAFTDSASSSLAQLNKILASEIDAKTGREMLKGLRQGLREMPKLLASIVPERSAQLVAEFEKKLGGSFANY